MTIRDTKIVEAASRVFARYGVSKTTMNDIATEAGVARQTLYNAYANKDEVLRATVRAAIAKTTAEIEEAWRNEHTFARLLDHFFEHMPLKWYDIVKSSPEAADLMDGINDVAAAEMEQAKIYWLERLTALMQKYSAPGSTVNANAAEMADFIYSTATQAKHSAVNREMLETRLAMLKACVLALMEAPN